MPDPHSAPRHAFQLPPGATTRAVRRSTFPRALFWATALMPVALLCAVAVARAHDAPSGWTYPFACCSGVDCRPVSAKTISEKPEGYVIAGTGEVVGYGDNKIRVSPDDDDYHWCSVAGMDDGKTICLFVPARMF